MSSATANSSLRFILLNFKVYPMFSSTLKRKPLAKDAIVGFETTATAFY